MSGCPAIPAVDLLVCFFLLHMRLWVRPAPGIPVRPLISRGTKLFQQLGRESAAGRTIVRRQELLLRRPGVRRDDNEEPAFAWDARVLAGRPRRKIEKLR